MIKPGQRMEKPRLKTVGAVAWMSQRRKENASSNRGKYLRMINP
jgi:hypothetical protein